MNRIKYISQYFYNYMLHVTASIFIMSCNVYADDELVSTPTGTGSIPSYTGNQQILDNILNNQRNLQNILTNSNRTHIINTDPDYYIIEVPKNISPKDKESLEKWIGELPDTCTICNQTTVRNGGIANINSTRASNTAMSNRNMVSEYISSNNKGACEPETIIKAACYDDPNSSTLCNKKEISSQSQLKPLSQAIIEADNDKSFETQPNPDDDFDL